MLVLSIVNILAYSHIHMLTLEFSGKVSGRKAYIRRTSLAARHSENRAGYWNEVYDCASLVLPRMENKAPAVGPNRNPSENAIPIAACDENNTVQ